MVELCPLDTPIYFCVTFHYFVFFMDDQTLHDLQTMKLGTHNLHGNFGRSMSSTDA